MKYRRFWLVLVRIFTVGFICCRYFVVSHFPLLESLDGEAVSESERFEAHTVYGERWTIKDRKMSKFFVPSTGGTGGGGSTGSTTSSTTCELEG